MKKLLLVLVLFASTTIYAQSYNQGFKDGWKNAYKRSSISSPIAPIPGIGRRTYQDGFADGAAAAYGKLNSNSQSTSRKSYNNISANEWEKVYNSGSFFLLGLCGAREERVDGYLDSLRSSSAAVF